MTLAPASGIPPVDEERRSATLESIARRVLWLSSLMVHHANRVRANPSGVKVGGHQASSASAVSLMTFLFFEWMRREDRISVKPHAAPVLHAIQYLLGDLDAAYLTRLREHHGLQAYPSQTKDPDRVDFSTGSMGLGAVAPNYAALAQRYVSSHFGAPAGGRFISVIGDAELDEGSVWETVAEPALADLDNVLWVIDLNRQSLDRVVPGIRVRQLQEMFRANGWAVVEAKYGRKLQSAFTQRPSLRDRIDAMSNEEYQFLLRADPVAIRRTIGPDLPASCRDDELNSLLSDLGGHDIVALRSAFATADRVDRPAVVFAYTVKGWGLPIAGDPMNHQALLSAEQIEQVALEYGIDMESPWAAFQAGSDEAVVCAERAAELRNPPVERSPAPVVPVDLGRNYTGLQSTQAAFGVVLTTIGRDHPQLAERIVTLSPDVAMSTNLGGWINRFGVWSESEQDDRFLALGPRLVRWERTLRGRHIELGISETNLMMALAEFGITRGSTGQQLIPIGTLYDPFVARGLEALIYALYIGSRFILVGTPSGVTLAPEGGAHQSVVTPSVGIGLPGLTYWEPCFAQEVEWILADALHGVQTEARSTYLRLSTLPIDQAFFVQGDMTARREAVLSGAYRLTDRGGEQPAVEIWATGVMTTEALRASEELWKERISAEVVHVTSPGAVYRWWQEAVRGRADLRLRPHAMASRTAAPVVTVIDGHPSGLAWVGSMLGVPAWPLGVTRYGESGLPSELYVDCEIDATAIVAACRRAIEGRVT